MLSVIDSKEYAEKVAKRMVEHFEATSSTSELIKFKDFSNDIE